MDPIGCRSWRANSRVGGSTSSPWPPCPRVGRGQGDHDDSHRVHRSRRPRHARSFHEPRPAERQRDRRQFLRGGVGGEAAGAPAGACAHRDAGGRAHQSGGTDDCRRLAAGRGSRCRRHGTATRVLNAVPLPTSTPPSRVCERAARRALHQRWPLPRQPARALALFATRHAVPAILSGRISRVGGLMSYGASQTETHRQAGLYVGRILGARIGFMRGRVERIDNAADAIENCISDLSIGLPSTTCGSWIATSNLRELRRFTSSSRAPLSISPVFSGHMLSAG